MSNCAIKYIVVVELYMQCFLSPGVYFWSRKIIRAIYVCGDDQVAITNA